MIRVCCQGCGNAFEVSGFLGGLTVICKGCGHRVPVPGGRPAATVAAATPAPISTAPAEPPAKAVPRLMSDAPAPPRKVTPEPFADVPFLPSKPESTPLHERATAMLDAGLPVPTIVQRLVALGLSPDVAEAVVIRIQDERADRARAREQRQEMAEEAAFFLRAPRLWLLHKLFTTWVGQIFLSAGLFFAAVGTYWELTKREAMGPVRMPLFLELPYALGGKWGLALGLAGLGALFGWWGLQKLIRIFTR